MDSATLPARHSVLRRGFATAFTATLLAGCATSDKSLPRGLSAYDVIASSENSSPQPYRIGPLDVLSISTFNEPGLSFAQIQVDAGGNLLFPLIGSTRAAGMTASELAVDLAHRLDARFTRDAQLTVVVASSVRQNVTIEGNVTEPGVYEIAGGEATLLQAIARAKSPTRTAKLNEVVVFRVIDGKRAGAVFDLAAIRAGRMPDPTLLGGDVVVVGFSAVKGAFRDLLTTAPFFSVFRAF